MQTIEFKVDDNYLGIIMTLLSNLKKNIIKDLKVTQSSRSGEENSKEGLDFSSFEIESFKNIDGLEYQTKIRDEW
jgi:hypothetical protein